MKKHRENHPEDYDSSGDLRDETPTPGGPGDDNETPTPGGPGDDDGTRTGPNGTRMVTMPDDDDA